MKRIIVLVGALWSLGAYAQEIGTELPPEPPPPPPSYDPVPSRPVAQAAPAAPAEPQKVPGPSAGTFGLRASFQGGMAPLGGAASTPTIGMRYLASDSTALNFDVGLGVGFGNDTLFGFGLGFGLDAYLGSPDKPLRPFVGGGLSLNAPMAEGFDVIGLGIDVGFGAEYWFSDHFSLSGRAALSVPLPNLSDLDQINIVTFQPGVAANFYF